MQASLSTLSPLDCVYHSGDYFLYILHEQA